MIKNLTLSPEFCVNGGSSYPSYLVSFVHLPGKRGFSLPVSSAAQPLALLLNKSAIGA